MEIISKLLLRAALASGFVLIIMLILSQYTVIVEDMRKVQTESAAVSEYFQYDDEFVIQPEIPYVE